MDLILTKYVRLLCSSGVLSQLIMRWMIYVDRPWVKYDSRKETLLRPSYSAYSLHGTPGQDPVSGPGVHCRVVAARRLKKARERSRSAGAEEAQCEGSRCTSGGAASRSQPRRVARERSRSAGAGEAQTPEEGEVALEERRRWRSAVA